MFDFFKKPEDAESIVMLPLDIIAPNRNQPRKYFDPQAMEELRDSIKEYGVINPVTVRRDNGEYEIISGERRFRAAQMAGLTEIPAMIVKADTKKSAILSLLENLQREDLTFLEVAESYRALIHEQGLTQTQLAEKVGKSRSSVSNKVRLLQLSPRIKKLVREYDLTESHALALLQLKDEEQQIEAVRLIYRDSLNAAQTAELVRNLQKSKKLQKVHIPLMNDTSLFKKSVEKSLDIMKQSGVEADMEEKDFDWGTEYTIKVKNSRK